eukprot:TRINITY_DN19873_c0_g2_i2.p1 TRINITY_DN19873_c0_g2~~TRINITY_DN19873_c0_g2_i2.p1  ORF type:complete len:133 (+),score=9.47 TRINITY_DN19873_c0_g2_i2:41-439(+)
MAERCFCYMRTFVFITFVFHCPRFAVACADGEFNVDFYSNGELESNGLVGSRCVQHLDFAFWMATRCQQFEKRIGIPMRSDYRSNGRGKAQQRQFHWRTQVSVQVHIDAVDTLRNSFVLPALLAAPLSIDFC